MFRTFRNKLVAALLSALLAAAPCAAQERIIGGGVFGGAATYQGPGDIVSGATAWFGLRAYNAAYATGLNKAINVRRASDNTTQDINVTATGALNIASANTFAGADATCSGSTTGLSTTIAFTSCSSTPHAGSTLVGTGLTQPSYIASCGTFVGGAGTCTLNIAQNIAVAESIAMQYGLYLTTAYDQTGNGNNASQATTANQPQLLPNCSIGSTFLPCMNFAVASSLSGSLPTSAQPYSFTFVLNPAGTTCSPCYLSDATNEFNSNNTSSRTVRLGAPTSASSSSNLSVGTGYSIQTLLSGTSGEVDVNGTISSSLSVGTNALSSTITWGGSVSLGINGAFAYTGEFGVWSSNTSSSWTNLTTNERTYWNF